MAKNNCGVVRVNMGQFRARWRDYSDTVRYGESIRQSNGVVVTLDVRPFMEWLNSFNIFYTVTYE